MPMALIPPVSSAKVDSASSTGDFSVSSQQRSFSAEKSCTHRNGTIAKLRIIEIHVLQYANVLDEIDN